MNDKLDKVEGGLLPLAVGTDAEWDESAKTGRQLKLIVRERQLREALSEIERLKKVEEFVECTGRARAVMDRALAAEAELAALKAIGKEGEVIALPLEAESV